MARQTLSLWICLHICTDFLPQLVFCLSNYHLDNIPNHTKTSNLQIALHRQRQLFQGSQLSEAKQTLAQLHSCTVAHLVPRPPPTASANVANARRQQAKPARARTPPACTLQPYTRPDYFTPTYHHYHHHCTTLVTACIPQQNTHHIFAHHDARRRVQITELQ